MSKTHDDSEPWYAVRCLFYHGDIKAYEERTVLVSAVDTDEAIAKAEVDAAEYCRALENVQYLKYVDTFHLFEKEVADGAEIFSLMRTIEIDKDAYIDRFLDSGTERRELVLPPRRPSARKGVRPMASRRGRH
jgi:hypothetical protein